MAEAKPKFLLLGSYESDGYGNINIDAGNYFSINLRTPPYSLQAGVLHTFDERTSKVIQEPDKKLLLLSGEYLAQIDFAAMAERC